MAPCHDAADSQHREQVHLFQITNGGKNIYEEQHFKRVMTLVLVMALLSGVLAIPGYAAQTDDDDYMVLEVTKKTTLRSDYYAKSSVLTTLEENTILFCKRGALNKYGNVWYECLYFPENGGMNGVSTGWVYSGNVKEHTCTFTEAEGSEELSFCRCGAISYEPSDMTQIGVAATLNPTRIPDIAGVLGTLGIAVQGAATAAAPYLVVGVVCGMVVYLAVSVAENAATLEKVAVDWEKLGKDFKPERGDYYNGIVSGDFLYIDRANPMDKQKAMSRIDILLCANTLTREIFQWFIYTLHEFDAYDLADAYVNSRSGVTFNCIIDAHTSGSMMRQYKHYHISSVFDPLGHLPGHIAFGAPMVDTYQGGAWA